MDSCMDSEWIQTWIDNELTLGIIDRYIMTSEGIQNGLMQRFGMDSYMDSKWNIIDSNMKSYVDTQ